MKTYLRDDTEHGVEYVTKADADAAKASNDGVCAWVPATERLPRSGATVLVWRQGVFPSLAPGLVQISRFHFTEDGPQWEVDQNRWLPPGPLGRNVTHWMPLPRGPMAHNLRNLTVGPVAGA